MEHEEAVYEVTLTSSELTQLEMALRSYRRELDEQVERYGRLDLDPAYWLTVADKLAEVTNALAAHRYVGTTAPTFPYVSEFGAQS